MSTLSYNRAAHQRIDHNIPCGKRPNLHPSRSSSAYVSTSDYQALNRAVDLIRKAQLASTNASTMVNLTAAYSLLRDAIANNR